MFSENELNGRIIIDILSDLHIYYQLIPENYADMFFRFVETSYSKFNQSAKSYLSTYQDTIEPSQSQSSEKSLQQSSIFYKNLSPTSDAAPPPTPMITTGSSTTADEKGLTRSRSLSIDLLNQPTSIFQIRRNNKMTVPTRTRSER